MEWYSTLHEGGLDMAANTLTPDASATASSVPGRAARDVNDWARGLPDRANRQLVLQRLAESLEGVGDLMEPRPDEEIAVFCLKTHDLLTRRSSRRSGRRSRRPSVQRIKKPPVDDRDDPTT